MREGNCTPFNPGISNGEMILLNRQSCPSISRPGLWRESTFIKFLRAISMVKAIKGDRKATLWHNSQWVKSESKISRLHKLNDLRVHSHWGQHQTYSDANCLITTSKKIKKKRQGITRYIISHSGCHSLTQFSVAVWMAHLNCEVM